MNPCGVRNCCSPAGSVCYWELRRARQSCIVANAAACSSQQTVRTALTGPSSVSRPTCSADAPHPFFWQATEPFRHMHSIMAARAERQV